MKKIWIIVLLAVFSTQIFGQMNLVPNPSFESYNQCPDNWDQLNRSNNWTKYNGESPDYWNACDTSNVASVPYNKAGFQFAASGNAYAGIAIYSLTGGSVNSYREYMGAQLTSPLVPNTRYYVTYKVSSTFGDTSVTQLKYACNNQCVLFTTSPYSQTHPLTILNFAQLVNSTVITDTANWTTLRWSFVADSIYQYIVLGNFFNDSLTTGILTNPSGGVPFAYYYIDEVCVSTDSMYCETTTGINEQSWLKNMSVYPNPCHDELSVEVSSMPSSAVTAIAYDLNGAMVLNKKLSFSNHTCSLNTQQLNTGMYLLLLQDKNESKKIIFIKN